MLGSHGQPAGADSKDLRLSKQIRKLLADDIAVRLLRMAHEGFQAKSSTYKSMGITKKQYYSRLNQLVRLQFVEKISNDDGAGRKGSSSGKERSMYVVTTLGKMIFKTQVRMIEELSENITNVNLIERIKTNYRHIGKDKIDKISTILLDNTSILRDVFASVGSGGNSKHDLDVLSDYETTISTSCELISKAKFKVQVASRYVHPDAVKEMMRAANYNNVDVRTIIEQSILARRLEDLKIDSREKLDANAQLIFPAKASIVKYRYSKVDYTFIVVDNLVSIIEVLSPFDQEFLLALRFNSREISERLGSIFESMWKRSSMPYECAVDCISSSIAKKQ